MIPVGYMRKHVERRPASLHVASVVDIYSMSGCISRNFCDYFQYWKHNGYWLFDSPQTIDDVATANAVDLTGTRLFYFEAYEYEFDERTKCWSSFAPEGSWITEVLIPKSKTLAGFDVVCFSSCSSPECSPLSCNGIGATLPVNEHCLFDRIEEAREALENGSFKNSEPGPYRIVAVFTVER